MRGAKKALAVGLTVLVLGFAPDATTAQERVNPQRIGGAARQTRTGNNNTGARAGRTLDANLQLGSGGYNSKRQHVEVINRDPYRPVRSRSGNLTYSSNSSFTPMFRYTATTYRQPFSTSHSRRFRGYADSYR